MSQPRLDLKAKVTANILDNTSKAITPEKHREVLDLISDNAYLHIPSGLNARDPESLGKSFAATGDGRLASDFYGTDLAALQADYAGAQLSDTMDQIVFEYGVKNGLDLSFEDSGFVFNRKSSFSTAGILTANIIFHKGGYITFPDGMSVDDFALDITNTNVNYYDLTVDVNHAFRVFLRHTGGVVNFYGNNDFSRGGLDGTSVTNFSAYVWITGDTIDVGIEHWKSGGIKATGNDADAYGTGQGSARDLFIAPNTNATGSVRIKHFVVLTRDADAREYDVINQNTNAPLMRTTIENLYVEYNTNTRRVLKDHEGTLDVRSYLIVPQQGFVTATPVGGDTATQVGKKTLHVASFAGSGTRGGGLNLGKGFIDYSGFPVGVIGGSAPAAAAIMIGGTLQGPTEKVSRFNLETGTDQRVDSVGFSGPANRDAGSYAQDVTFIDGHIQFKALSHNQKAIGCTFKNPIRHAFWAQLYGETGAQMIDCKFYISKSTALGSERKVVRLQGSATGQIEVIRPQCFDEGSGIASYTFIELAGDLIGRVVDIGTVGDNIIPFSRSNAAYTKFEEINTNYRAETVKEVHTTNGDEGKTATTEVLTDLVGSITLRITDSAGNIRVI